ncbi:hypothetical protein [Flavobacterium sp. JP2137]|uniref:hypothetical protein n=1 Tax=Flavobacterium sp. JP2137 TaxID=3414510 RepID=UPI003D2FB3AF
MYDSLITLIQMLDNSKELTVFKIQGEAIYITISDLNPYLYHYSHDGISEAIEELEDLL